MLKLCCMESLYRPYLLWRTTKESCANDGDASSEGFPVMVSTLLQLSTPPAKRCWSAPEIISSSSVTLTRWRGTFYLQSLFSVLTYERITCELMVLGSALVVRLPCHLMRRRKRLWLTRTF